MYIKTFVFVKKFFFKLKIKKKRKEMSTKSQKIKEAIKEFCLDTTAHGFANIVKTDLIIIKLIWSVIVVLAFNYCAYRKYLF